MRAGERVSRVVVMLIRKCAYWHILGSPQMGDGSRAMFSTESAGIGLPKVEAAAKTIRVVSDS